MRRATKPVLVLAFVLASWPAAAQQTTGSIIGRVTDSQGAGVPGATVQAGNQDTGLLRATSTDRAGLYRLDGLPVGVYDLAVHLPGFTSLARPGVIVHIGAATDIDAVLGVAQVTETITVTAASPLVSTTSSAMGQVVDVERIQNLPLNGRQFANLAATVPGVGLGFHSESSKSTQYSPQISGGNGRNVSYIVDGGDNNEDIVGGLLQLFPLEAIQEFNVLTQRFDAEYGRSNGAVINVVTKSGTNTLRGSGFTLFRDKALNARTFTEQRSGFEKQAYRRYQFGGSVGGPISRDRVHYFAAIERTQQDTRQVVDTLGLFPEEDGAFDIPVRQSLFTGKVTAVPGNRHYLAVRYGFDRNSQPSGAGLRAARSSWETSTNRHHSLAANHNWLIGDSALNELVVQYSDYVNEIPSTVTGPHLRFPNGVTGGANPIAPQGAEQTKWQFRNDFSRTVSGFGGLSHTFKGGVNWIHEPHLFISIGQGSSGIFFLGTNDVNGPVQLALVIGGNTAYNVPMDQYSLYGQDDWRVTDRLTLNLGLRWDYTDGMPIDQELSRNFQLLQAAGRTGRFEGTLLEDFGQDPKSDLDNIQPRLGAVYDLRGDGRDVLRGGWGVYSDVAYLNANALTAAIDAGGGAGIMYQASAAAGLRKADGTLFRTSDPLSTIAHLNTVDPTVPLASGEVVSPLLEQPYTYQTSLGWAHEVSPSTALTVDYVRVEGRDLNMRIRPNVLVNGQRFLAGLPIQPNSSAFRVAVSKGESLYNALIVGVRRRLTSGLDLNASYTAASATSDIGTASDEIVQDILQDVTDPFGDVQDAPSTRTDARHRVSASAIVEAPWGVRVAPIFYYRSPLPVHTFEGRDLNGDGQTNDITALAYKYTGLTDAGAATFEEIGSCETVNCSRRAPFSQLDLRVSKSFALAGSVRVDAIAEVFNLFNAKNPFIPLSSRRRSAAGAPLGSFMQPMAYAGDFQQPEQRVGQIGFRITF
jgi:hypothetical protein